MLSFQLDWLSSRALEVNILVPVAPLGECGTVYMQGDCDPKVVILAQFCSTAVVIDTICHFIRIFLIFNSN